MKVALLSPHDHQGGASRIGHYVYQGMRKMGHDAQYFVGRKSLEDAHIHRIVQNTNNWQKYFGKAVRVVNRELGREHFHYPGSRRLFQGQWKPELIHAHNLQGGYFDLNTLPQYANDFPFLLTLHDPWMFSGHCSYFIHCNRWQSGCGDCPDLNRNPSLKRDGTHGNWLRKKAIYSKSPMYVATPSQWLMDEMDKSIMSPSVRLRKVINNGVDTAHFQPKVRRDIRKELNIPEDALVLLYVVNSQMKENPYKDYDTIHRALQRLESSYDGTAKIYFIGLGQEAETEHSGKVTRLFFPYQKELSDIAAFFQAADLYLHAARAENYPNVVMEALSCGTPVVATEVGGVPEQIIEGKTGWVVPFEGFQEMADKIIELEADRSLLKVAGQHAAEWIREDHKLSDMLIAYQHFYEEIIEDFKELNHVK